MDALKSGQKDGEQRYFYHPICFSVVIRLG